MLPDAMDANPHAFFIVAAYAATALVVAGLIARALWDHRTQRRRLADLEDRGARRRSEPGRDAAHRRGFRSPSL